MKLEQIKSGIALLILVCVWSVSNAQKKNVLFIITDDLNCNLGTYDHYMVKTPNIDKLAIEGRQFNNAFCSYPQCGASRASMMTGLYPSQTGHFNLRDTVRQHVPDITTLSQVFINDGYEATRVGKIYHYDNPGAIGTNGHDDELSWTERYNPIGRDKLEEDKIFSLKKNSFGGVLSWLAADGEDEEHTDGMVATKAIELLEEYAKEDTPFFLGVGFYKPHTPYVAPKKYFEMYDRADIIIPSVPENYLSTLPVPAQKSLTRKKPQLHLSDSLARSATQAYYATISFLDTQVGRVLTALKESGLDKNTIIVFTSDHGYHMGEHDYYQKTTLFEDSGRIPLIISYPGMTKTGKETESIVEMIDLYPTLCELAGLTAPEYVSGKSFVDVLDNPKNKSRTSALMLMNNGCTLRTENFRYTRWETGGSDMVELYDRKKDPAELHNIAYDKHYEEQQKKLDQLLDERMEQANMPPENLKVIK